MQTQTDSTGSTNENPNAAKLEDAIEQTHGLPEVSAAWVHEHLGSFRLIDVRQPGELRGPMGHVGQAENIPLGELMTVAAEWRRDEPVVILCASGGRSGRAAVAFERAGFAHVASMRGGMMAWCGLCLP